MRRAMESCRLLVFLVSSALIASITGCGRGADAPLQNQRPAETTSAPEETDVVTVRLPRGDAAGGRQAFLDLKCTTCHRVAGEASFPEPAGATRGPDLDGTLAIRPVADLAEAILAPSHSVSLRVSDETKTQLEGMLTSPMGDFSEAMTVRQVADLLAFLRSLEPPAETLPAR